MEQVLQEPMLHWALRTFLAVMFTAAAVSKLTGLEEFYGVVRNFRVLPDALSRAVAMVLPVVELAVAAGLLITPLAAPAALSAAGLLVVFGLAIAINVLRGRTQIDCGCFRNGMKQRISWAMVGRNVVLTAMALSAAALLPLARPAGAMDLAAGMMAGTVLFLLYFSASMLARLPARQTTTASLKGR
ncbi:hypothetical protein GCM10011402_35500 [Paracoccus acridae]|uniref:Methylamine utilization protein MauE n=1 Tax=Paracoccus acridae TaxID=1795310 RepID=A0ABQ1VNI0_9RHOB|nr:MauE/DoxX family redox-associated membrane protein [Paracoccus acridae]GGF79792.1 hypothetical protein GCM10011402_35500 [Paracoccus acridae]